MSFAQCECGAYRACEVVDGKRVWVGGCRACDAIQRKDHLLAAGVRIVRQHASRSTIEELREVIEAMDEEIRNRPKPEEDRFACPRCGRFVRRGDIPLHPAHEQAPPWNTGFEWVGSCPHCEAERRGEARR